MSESLSSRTELITTVFGCLIPELVIVVIAATIGSGWLDAGGLSFPTWWLDSVLLLLRLSEAIGVEGAGTVVDCVFT